SHFSEYRINLADHQFEHIDLLIQNPENVFLERVSNDQIEDKNLPFLPDSMQPPDTLLNRHRIPRQIEVDQRVAELKVASLAAGFGAYQKRNLSAELLYGLVLVGHAYRPVVARGARSCA